MMSGWTILLIITAILFWVFRGGFKRVNAAKKRGETLGDELARK